MNRNSISISQLSFRIPKSYIGCSTSSKHSTYKTTHNTKAFYRITAWKETIPESNCGTLLFPTRVCSCPRELGRSSECTHMYRSTKEPLWANFGSWRSQTVREPQEIKQIRWINDGFLIERIKQPLRRLKFKAYHRCLQKLFTTVGNWSWQLFLPCVWFQLHEEWNIGVLIRWPAVGGRRRERGIWTQNYKITQMNISGNEVNSLKIQLVNSEKCLKKSWTNSRLGFVLHPMGVGNEIYALTALITCKLRVYLNLQPVQ